MCLCVCTMYNNTVVLIMRSINFIISSPARRLYSIYLLVSADPPTVIFLIRALRVRVQEARSEGSLQVWTHSKRKPNESEERETS